jgi:hypothetical protein
MNCSEILGLVMSGVTLFGCHPHIDCSTPEAREGIRKVQEYHPYNEYAAALFIEKNFDYVHDRSFLFWYVDYWQSPMQTAARKKGDCDDFALLGCYLAEKLGYKPLLLSINSVFEGHFLALLHNEKTRKYGVLGEGFYIYPDYDSIDSLISEGINPKSKGAFTHYKVISPEDMRKDWRTTCHDLTALVSPFSLRPVKK